MSGAAGAILCCCDQGELCGSCPASYLLTWSGSVELLATCCPTVECPEPNPEAGEFTTVCDPCQFIIQQGGNSCRGDCPGIGCYLATYNEVISASPTLIVANQGCEYAGAVYGGGPCFACCPPDPQRPYCSSGQVGTITWYVSFEMRRAGTLDPGPAGDWIIRVTAYYEFDSFCQYPSYYRAFFRAPNSATKCPHEVTFNFDPIQSDEWIGSQLDPCNIDVSYCLRGNVHAADAGTVSVTPA